MFRSRLAFTLGAAALMVAAPLGNFPSAPFLGSGTAQAQQATVSFSVFFENLAPHGRWVRNSHYHYVWCPEVEQTWAPYTHGHWVYLDGRGWYFASDEPFAWAAYHYGRWYRDADVGWCWVPGTVWAPAWVSWRRSADYVGWAPLRPEGDGFALSLEISSHEPPHEDWFFIPTHSFLRPQLSVEIVFGAQNQDVFDRTEFVGPVTVENNIVVNNVITVNFIEQQTKEKVPVLKAQAVSDPKAVSATPDGQTIAVFDAKVDQPKKDDAPAQAIDAAHAAKDKGTPAPAAGATTPGAATDANAAAGGKVTAPAAGGKPAATCLPAEMVDGVCPPDKGKKAAGKPAATDATQPADTSKTTPKTIAPADNAATPPAAPVTQTAPAKGKDVAKCAPAEMVDGVCPPGGKKPKDVNKPAADTAPATNTAPAASDTQNGAAAPAAVEAPKGKPGLKCLPDEELVKGACVPKGAAKGNGNTDATPSQ